MSFGIITRKLNATNLRGTRVQAKMHTAQGQTRSKTFPYEHSWSLVENEFHAANMLAKQYGAELKAEDPYDYVMACGQRVWVAETP